MRYLLASLFPILLAGCVTAREPVAPYAASEPTRFAGVVKPVAPPNLPRVKGDIVEVSRASLPFVCQLPAGGLVGCTTQRLPRCKIYIADNLSPALKAEVIDHEETHCGGWSHGN